MIRKLYLVLGLVSLSIGFAGIFLPLVPTTPLVLLAAFFFSRSSPRIHRWLRAHRRFGPIQRDWENGQVIRPGAKAASVVLMFGLVGYSVWFVVGSPYLSGAVDPCLPWCGPVRSQPSLGAAASKLESSRGCATAPDFGLVKAEGGVPEFPARISTRVGALNSAVECHLHTVEVTGSNPVAPTIPFSRNTSFQSSPAFRCPQGTARCHWRSMANGGRPACRFRRRPAPTRRCLLEGRELR